MAIVDYDRPICYLYEWSKAWHYNFANLAELAGAVLSAKVVLVTELKVVVAEGSVAIAPPFWVMLVTVAVTCKLPRSELITPAFCEMLAPVI